MRVVFFTGAGLSAESGLPTFRGEGGLYDGIRAEDVLSSEGYRRDPAFVEDFMATRRAQMRRAEPNEAHVAIAQYAHKHPGTIVLTQNIDDLLERAGVSNPVHLHGDISQLRCLGHSHVCSAGVGSAHEERCVKCGSRLRTDVVLFGEHAPNYAVLRVMLASQTQADAIVIVGTQGNVIPIGRILPMVHGFKALVNLHPSEDLPAKLFDIVQTAPATIGLPLVLEALEESELQKERLPKGTPLERRALRARASRIWNHLVAGGSPSSSVK